MDRKLKIILISVLLNNINLLCSTKPWKLFVQY